MPFCSPKQKEKKIILSITIDILASGRHTKFGQWSAGILHPVELIFSYELVYFIPLQRVF